MESEKTFYFEGDSHTLSSLFRAELLKDPNVLFAAYKVPHPLFKKSEVYLQVLEGSPDDAMACAKKSILKKLKMFLKELEDI